MTKKIKYNLGAIVAVQLPDKRYAYAKIFKDSNFGVYDYLTNEIEIVDEVVKHRISFFQSATDSEIKSGKWIIIGQEPFSDEESSWGPPKAAGVLPGDDLGPISPLLVFKGKMRNVKLEEVIGLDIEGFCQRPDLFIEVIVDRLIKGNHDKYRVQV